MMRFPLRLTADLTLARIARKLRPLSGIVPIQFVDSAEILHIDSSHPVSHDKIREIISGSSPIVWIGGSEPLEHPGIAHLVRAITQSGHFVFLETDGTLLRRRIHEFQPVSRLFLTVRLDSGALRRPPGGLTAAASGLALEGIRAARLSGFSICGHLRVAPETEVNDAAKLFDLARSLDVDGIVISPVCGEVNSSSQHAEVLTRKTAEARKLIGSRWWESFSRLVEAAVSGEKQFALSGEDAAGRVEQDAQGKDEGVRVA